MPEEAAATGTRRLKAIMFTDIKGYSTMMGVDEARTVRLVTEHREHVRAALAVHGGQEHETIGDAFVVLFDSVVNAVRCGMDIQQRLRERNAGRPVDDQVWVRIGIHLGDIIMQGDGIYGDGVNLAARVESKANPGGICITEQVFLQIDGKIDATVEAMGRTELKNIRNPPRLYRIDVAGEQLRPASRKVAVGTAVAGAVLAVALVAAWWGAGAPGAASEPPVTAVPAAAPAVAVPVALPLPAPPPLPAAAPSAAPASPPVVAPAAPGVQDAPGIAVAVTPAAAPAAPAIRGTPGHGKLRPRPDRSRIKPSIIDY